MRKVTVAQNGRISSWVLTNVANVTVADEVLYITYMSHGKVRKQCFPMSTVDYWNEVDSGSQDNS